MHECMYVIMYEDRRSFVCGPNEQCASLLLGAAMFCCSV